MTSLFLFVLAGAVVFVILAMIAAAQGAARAPRGPGQDAPDFTPQPDTLAPASLSDPANPASPLSLSNPADPACPVSAGGVTDPAPLVHAVPSHQHTHDAPPVQHTPPPPPPVMDSPPPAPPPDPPAIHHHG